MNRKVLNYVLGCFFSKATIRFVDVTICLFVYFFFHPIETADLLVRSVENVFDPRKIWSCMCVSTLESVHLCVYFVAEHLVGSRIWHGICVFTLVKGRTIANRVANALHALIIYQSILRRMFTIRRHAEMRDGGGESSTIDNDIRLNYYSCLRIP